jgi:hypothetical protein
MAFYVYMLASKKHGTLYLGVTNNIVRRTYELRLKPVVMDTGLGPKGPPRNDEGLSATSLPSFRGATKSRGWDAWSDSGRANTGEEAVDVGSQRRGLAAELFCR